MPLIAPLERVHAPAARVSPLRVNEPPDGKPPTTPAARFAKPWPMNSYRGPIASSRVSRRCVR